MTALIETDEQRGLREALRGLLAKRSDSAAVRTAVRSDTGHDVELWRALSDQIGVPALAIPEGYGGAGATDAEAQIAFEELGRMLTPSPMLSSFVAARLLLALADEDACRRLLPRIAAGEVVALAWADEHGWHDGAVGIARGALSGTAHYVLDGEVADVLLVVTPEAIVEVAGTAAGVTRRRVATMDPTRSLATVGFDDAHAAPLDGDAHIARAAALDAACIALAAEAAGGAARILELTVAYTKVRVQFGRPIGSFQALKHRMADLYVLAESSRSASLAAAAGSLDPAVAKVYCAEAFQTIAGEAIQLHGGIAITWEHDAHLYFKRAHGIAQLFGQAPEHIGRIAVRAGIEDA